LNKQGTNALAIVTGSLNCSCPTPVEKKLGKRQLCKLCRAASAGGRSLTGLFPVMERLRLLQLWSEHRNRKSHNS